MAKFCFVFDKTYMLFEDFSADGFAKDNVLKPILQSRYNYNINDISGLGVSYLFGVGNFNEL